MSLADRMARRSFGLMVPQETNPDAVKELAGVGTDVA